MIGEINVYSLIGLVIRSIAIAIILFYIIPKQFKEVLRPRDWLTGLRWQMLLMFSFAILASVPSVVYQILRTIGVDAPVLRDISSVTGNLSFLAISLLLVMIYNYKRKE